MIPKSHILNAHQKNKLTSNINSVLLGYFTDFEVNKMIKEILNRRDRKLAVILFDVSLMVIK